MEKIERVLHVLGRLDRGGAETMVMNLYRNIDRSKIQFDFIIHTDDECDYTSEILQLGGRIYSISKYNVKNHIKYKKEWSDFFYKHPEYKIIHGHVRSTAAIYLKIAKKYKLTTISHSHNISSGNGIKAIVKNILQYPIRYIADYFFACSNQAGIWLFGKKVCRKSNFFIVNNSIDSKRFMYNKKVRSQKRLELGLENNFVIGHIGRFHPQKNHTFLIDIFKHVIIRKADAKLLLIGDGELFDYINNKVSMLGLQKNVVFIRRSDNISELLQAVDVFVFPSLYEGLGMVAIEAQAAGLPTIVSDSIPEEAFITNLIKKINLSLSEEKWAEEILKYSSKGERNNMYEEICNKGYDINNTAKWLESFYMKGR